jgi:hypothetical protein
MGKKTLEEVGKIILVTLISIIMTSIYARRSIIDGKMGRDEYKEDQSQRWAAHDAVEAERAKRTEDMYNMVKENNTMLKKLNNE